MLAEHASSTEKTEASDGKSPFAAPAITLPTGGGAIRGIGEKFAANPVTGTGSMSIPIFTSPGRSGFGPQLSLTYDSGAGNGPFGFGWSLSLPSITRKTGHGRLERRTLESSTGLCGYLDWPGVAQVMRRRCERTIVATGEYSCEVSYGLTDLRPLQAGAAQLECLWRGHWTTETRDQYVRDVTLGEDAGQAHTGSTAQALAAWRNGILMVLRRAGWRNIADAVRAYAASVHNALDLIGVLPSATLT